MDGLIGSPTLPQWIGYVLAPVSATVPTYTKWTLSGSGCSLIALIMLNVEPILVYKACSGYLSAAGDTIAPMWST